MVDFQEYSASHIVDGNYWNQLLEHGLRKPFTYIVEKTSAGKYRAIDGSTGKIAYGDADDVGSVSGDSFSAVMQACVDALATAGSGTIYICEGEYTVDAQIEITSPLIHIMGAGNGEEGDSVTRLVATSGHRCFYIHYVAGDTMRGVWIENMEIDGAGSSDGQEGMRVDNVKRFKVYTCTFRYWDTGLIISGDCWTPKVFACSFQYNRIGTKLGAKLRR